LDTPGTDLSAATKSTLPFPGSDAKRDFRVVALMQGGHPLVPLAIAFGLFASIFVLRLSVDTSDGPITVLYVFPIALLGVVFGLRVGALAALLGVLLVVVWIALDDFSPSVVGWFGRIVPLLVIGLLVGNAADRLRGVSVSEQASFAARLGELEAAEVQHSIVRELIVAKAYLQGGQIEESLGALENGLAAAEALVADLKTSQLATWHSSG
jgi:hypothetical protein